MRTTRRTPFVAVAAAALLLAACGGDDATTADPGAEGDTEAPTEAQTDAAEETTEGDGADSDADGEAGAATTVGTTSSDFGTILVDGEGRTLYMFDNDSEGSSACTGDCAQTWPPLTGEAEVSGEADASLLGTIQRDDGTTQVTYGGLPLYYYAADAEAGDVNGQAVGGVWWVVGADGSRITEEAAASGESEPADPVYQDRY